MLLQVIFCLYIARNLLLQNITTFHLLQVNFSVAKVVADAYGTLSVNLSSNILNNVHCVYFNFNHFK